MLFWHPRKRGCQCWTPSVSQRGDHLRGRFELQTWPLMLVMLLFLCKLAEESMLIVCYSAPCCRQDSVKYMNNFVSHLTVCLKTKKRESYEKTGSILPGWPYYMTFPNLWKHALCILCWTHPPPPCPTSSVLVASSSPLSCSHTPGHKSATLTEHHLSQMVHLPPATL